MFKPLVWILCLIFPFMALAENFVAGKDYKLLSASQKSTTDKAKVAVTEFFSYGCPWCYRIDSSLMTWVSSQGDRIQFSHVPVVFHKDWTYYAKAYYTAHLLGLDAKLSPQLFKAVQSKGKTELNSNQAMIDFFISQGVDPKTAKSAFENSTTIDMEVSQGMALMSRFQINGVPAFVINNQYKTDLEMAKNEERLLKILDYLVAKSKKGS